MRGERTGGHRARNLAGALAPHEERVCRELVPRDALDETGRLYRVEPCLGWVKRFTPQSCLVRSRFGRFTGARYKTTALQRARARGTSNNERVLLEKSGREEGRGVSSQYGREGGGLWAARVRTGAEAVILGEGGVVRLEPLLHLHRRWVGLRPLCTGQGRGARQVCTGKGGRDAGGRAPTCQIGTCGCDERRCLPTSPCACSPFNDRKIYTENLRGSPTDDHDLVHFMCGGAV